ncbi:MAG: citrate synthase [Omnitrophica bacterium RIFCSPHIGHO2_02_FULL_51_18]|nr:MAG: citrate synthase [Omnitrophica bacterium RIFCSPHIGHO2_02_FULL_51_18]
MSTPEQSTFSKGLEDVVAAESSICLIDGKNSRLSYRGYDIHDLAVNSNFEETAYLLLFGDLPTERQLIDFKNKLASERELPKDLVRLIESFPKTANPMAALRTGVSLLSFYDPEADDKSAESNIRKTIRLMARVPSIVAYFDRVRRNEKLVHPKLESTVSTAANFLYMMKGEDATPTESKMLDKYFVLLAEHDLNASTFAAVITVSTLSDIYSAIVSAVGTLKGDLHGSANSRTMESLIAIGSLDKVEAFVEDALQNKKKLMGFGHRVYKGPDPRADDLRLMAKTLAENNKQEVKWFAISEKLEQTVWARKKLNCNVDFYSASVLYTIGIPVDLFTPMFAISRMAGWTAHLLEQLKDNRLIRPVSEYVGAQSRAYIPISNRK